MVDTPCTIQTIVYTPIIIILRDILYFFDCSMDLDPTARTTFWGVVIGMGTTWVANMGVNPSSVQRFLSVPSIAAAKRYLAKSN